MGLRNDNYGVIPPIAWIAIFVVGAIGSYIAIENITQQPDITYNVTESPFSFFGSSVNWIWIIIIGVIIVFALLWIFGKSKQKTQTRQSQQYYIREGREIK